MTCSQARDDSGAGALSRPPAAEPTSAAAPVAALAGAGSPAQRWLGLGGVSPVCGLRPDRTPGEVQRHEAENLASLALPCLRLLFLSWGFMLLLAQRGAPRLASQQLP